MGRLDTTLSLDFLKFNTRTDESSSDFESEIDPQIELLIKKVEKLHSLNDGWMGYASAAPSAGALTGAAFFITCMLRPDLPSPDIFPCPNGNIQLEWSCFDIDFEVEIESITQYYTAFEDLASGESWEKALTYDLSEVRAVLLKLVERKSATEDRPTLVHG
ncbi:hypothetical protein [Marinobacter sp. bablab_jr008]|uniref:hypothetical protein n=1 Tax=Marinobacter sp. bablab_jr008 TaxID=2755064 RepID=UPI0018F19079|nr:hypothetical protein [Marinobacter sp. bablab_jr008]MEC9386973.1 hypothetical protein [Pseudomonadota bacterium]